MKTRVTCRVCDGAFVTILSLGEQFVSNFLQPDEPEGTKAPLELMLCRRCSLVQLKHTVPPFALYQNYWYRSGTNRTMRTALADITCKSEQLMHLTGGDSVLDVGCNDGTLLASYKTGNIFKAGFDPAENLATLSRKVADYIVTDFFTAESFRSHGTLSKHPPKIITSIAMFYDLEEPGKFVSDIKKVMHPDGLWIVQMSYLPYMLKQNELGNICHEHLEYYAFQSFEYLLKLHDFEIVDVELNDVNGGSFRIYIRNKGADAEVFGDATYRNLAARRVRSIREQEIRLGLNDLSTYQDFAFFVERIKNDVVNFIRTEVGRGKKVYVYGASTKGNTVLQYFGLDHALITAAAERNPDKWGRVTVGSRIPIVSEGEARNAKPDYFLMLPWHFLEEFQARERDFLLSGGRFIMPAPRFALI